VPQLRHGGPVPSAVMSFVDTLISFLEVAIHTVLHARGVYPPQVFELRKKYNLPVRMSSAPALSRYIGSALSDPQLRNWIQHGFVERLVLAIKSAKHSNRVVERFVFEFAGAVANMSSSSCDTTEHGNLPVDAVKNSAGPRTAAIGSSDAVEELLRQSLIRLAGCDRLLRPALPGAHPCSLVVPRNHAPIHDPQGAFMSVANDCLL
jgi:hypothetical protein